MLPHSVLTSETFIVRNPKPIAAPRHPAASHQMKRPSPTAGACDRAARSAGRVSGFSCLSGRAALLFPLPPSVDTSFACGCCGSMSPFHRFGDSGRRVRLPAAPRAEGELLEIDDARIPDRNHRGCHSPV
jgi:hypothetical protein